MPPTLRTSNILPIKFKSTDTIFITNSTGIIKLLVRMLKAMPAIADFKYLFLRLRILSSFIKVSFRFPLDCLNSSVRILDLSMVLPSLFVSDSSINPTPEISATGVMLDCKNNMKCFVGSKMIL